MEELCDYYRYAVENKIDAQFKFREFNNFSLLTKFLKEEGIEASPDQIVVDTLKEYAKKSGYIDIHGEMVSLTEKGLAECNKPHHDWGWSNFSIVITAVLDNSSWVTVLIGMKWLISHQVKVFTIKFVYF